MIHVLFDIDSTILSAPSGANGEASAVMFDKFFHVQANEDMIDNAGKTELGIIREVLAKVQPEKNQQDIPDEAFKIWAEATTKALEENKPYIHPGIPEFITALSKLPNIILSLLTGNSSYRSEAKLASVGLDAFFKDESGQLRGAFGDSFATRAELFEQLKQQVTNEDRFIIVDDSLIGAKMAKLYQIPIILVATGHVKEDELKEFSPYVFSDFGEKRWEQAVAIIEKI